MAKRVIVIASGETERRALPHLLRHLADEGIVIDEPIRTPPRNGQISGELAYKLIVSAWYERQWTAAPPSKFVVLVDADSKSPQAVVDQLNEELSKTGIGGKIHVPCLLAAAKWHLEAWFFADPPALSKYLGKGLGSVDLSKPDEILNPKLCLKHLLEIPYTSRVAEEIAQRVSADEVRSRSPSFTRFEQAIRNGPTTTEGVPVEG